MLKRYKIAFGLNILNFFTVIAGMVIILLDYHFPTNYVNTLNWSALRNFTTISSLIIGVDIVISEISIILLWTKKIKVIPLWINIVNLLSVTAEAITLVLVLLVLLPMYAIQGKETKLLFMDSAMFQHLITPVLSICVYIFCLYNKKEIKLSYTPIAASSMSLYSIIYIILCYTHLDKGGKPYSPYDWYEIFQSQWYLNILLVIGLICLSYLISWLLWLSNKKFHHYLNSRNKKLARV